ncbi:nitronate monooxygenase [Pulveribacter suum]|uniref:2-nitropropane dioxygenase n=1 Tax=Pulveribacter suum TaxID=2116657 RepID=A0A2P1NPG5_9BURK|nr:nitronate monooxygenase [Pulveribacter suum]AVP58903.1 2-nitropropane dioxygenase [Pulveribacter suum]
MPATLPRTPLCDLLGCRLPIVLAGMGGVARSQLVAAVTQAGGFGFLGMVREPLQLIEREVAAVRAAGHTRFGVNLIPAGTEAALLASQIDLCIALQVPVVGLFWDVHAPTVERLRAAGITVVHQVGSARHALAAQAAGAHALIAQGVEAGGHVHGRQPLAEVLGEVLALAEVPVAAAGGLADGQDVARVLAAGAQAAVLGTAFIATEESFAHDVHKQHLLAAQAGDTVLTEAFHINWPPHAPVRVLACPVTRGERGDPQASGRTVIGEEEGRPIYLFSTDSPLRSMTGELDAMALYAGCGVGKVDAIVPAAALVQQLAQEAAAHLALLTEPPVEYASPVCYAPQFERERDDQLAARLNELLEAERAGARITLESARALQPGQEDLRPLIESIHDDEVKWCGMLLRALRSLGVQPSSRTGDFYERAMAVQDLGERLALLNRGQGWVARKVRELLAELEHEELRDGLQAMLQGHQHQLAQVNRRLGLDAPAR